MSTAAVPLPRRSPVLAAIFWGGLSSGALDITAAFVVYGSFGLKPIPLLQGIASGLLGARAWGGGLATAALGLFFHFFIAFSATAVYYAAADGNRSCCGKPCSQALYTERWSTFSWITSWCRFPRPGNTLSLSK